MTQGSARRLASLFASIALALALGGGAGAQTPVVASASVDRNVLTIGDPIKLVVVVEAEDGYRVAPPPQLAKFGELDVLDALPVLQGTPARGVTRYTFRYFVTSFQLGDHVVPAFEFEYSDPNGVLAAVRTTPLAIRVRSVVQAGEDATDIKPLKPQLDLPGSAASRLRHWGTVTALVLAVTLPVVAVVRALRRRRRPFIVVDREHTPAQETLRELRRIASLNLPQKGRADEHYELLAKAMRRYLATQYGIPAAQRTSRELYRDMERAGIERRQAAAVHEILRESEAVRFQRAPRHARHAQEAVAAAVAALAKVAAAERPEIEVAS